MLKVGYEQGLKRKVIGGIKYDLFDGLIWDLMDLGDLAYISKRIVGTKYVVLRVLLQDGFFQEFLVEFSPAMAESMLKYNVLGVYFGRCVQLPFLHYDEDSGYTVFSVTDLLCILASGVQRRNHAISFEVLLDSKYTDTVNLGMIQLKNTVVPMFLEAMFSEFSFSDIALKFACIATNSCVIFEDNPYLIIDLGRILTEILAGRLQV